MAYGWVARGLAWQPLRLCPSDRAVLHCVKLAVLVAVWQGVLSGARGADRARARAPTAARARGCADRARSRADCSRSSPHTAAPPSRPTRVCAPPLPPPFICRRAAACAFSAGRWALAGVLVLGARIAADGVDVRVARRRRGSAAAGWGAPEPADGGPPHGAGPPRDAPAPAAAAQGRPPPDATRAPPAPPQPPRPHADAWRAAVGDAAVAAAWERFSGAVVQEFVYDAFFAGLSPDAGVPREARRLLNGAFGQLARRARSRRIDWGGLLVGDTCAALAAVVGRYRAAVAGAGGRDALRGLPPGARDARLRAAMAAAGGLHPAFAAPDGHYRVRAGQRWRGGQQLAWAACVCAHDHEARACRPPSPPAHAQVLRALSEGAMAALLPPEDAGCPLLSALLRELFATCLLRSTMMYFTPSALNRVRAGRGAMARAARSMYGPAQAMPRLPRSATPVPTPRPPPQLIVQLWREKGPVAGGGAAAAAPKPPTPAPAVAAALAAGCAAFEARVLRTAEAEAEAEVEAEAQHTWVACALVGVVVCATLQAGQASHMRDLTNPLPLPSISQAASCSTR